LGVNTNNFFGAVADNVLDLIGNTPVVRLQKVTSKNMATIWAKLERQNPGGCIKERISLAMISTAERQGKIKSGTLIVEPTSGNTGIGLAMVAAFKGYRLMLVMPETVSIERRKIFQAYGAELVLVPGEGGMEPAISKANEIVKANPSAYMPNQFENPANPEIHRKTTAIEILNQVPQLDAVVACIGTGGTITGVGEVVKAEIPHAEIVAIEPAESPILSGGKQGKHKIQGMGAGFIPPVLNIDIYDRIVKVHSSQAIDMTRQLARCEGLLVGISSGAAVVAAIEVAKRLGSGKTVVTILPDTGERYLSTGVFDD
jgi:cysteine synthase A